jgi:Tfp pilus assembly protein PilO
MIARLLLARFVTDLEARYKSHEAQIANLPALERSLAELESRAQAQEQELQESRRLAESASRENARLRQLLAKATVR